MSNDFEMPTDNDPIDRFNAIAAEQLDTTKR